MEIWRRYPLLSLIALGLAVAAPVRRANAEPDCAPEIATLQGLSSGIQIDIRVPQTLTAGSSVEVSWQAKTRAPLKAPLFIIVAVPGEVRFEAPPLSTKPTPAPDATSAEPQQPELPGFIGLTPDAKGPLGLMFGAGKSRALIPPPISRGPSSPAHLRFVFMGQQPVELSATRLVKLSKDLPHDWHAQRQVLGLSRLTRRNSPDKLHI